MIRLDLLATANKKGDSKNRLVSHRCRRLRISTSESGEM